MTIVLRSLVVRSGGTTLVNGVALRLAPASRTALVGASGAGKSLTCAALAGTLPASLEVNGSLTVELDDADAGSDSRASSAPGGEASSVNLLGLPAARRPRGSRIALVAQDHSTALHPLIAVGRQIALASQAAGRTRDEARQRASDYLYAVGLDESFADRVPGRLSGGQRQRISLALALAAEPVLIIADEPTTALDVVARAEILRLLTSLTSLPEAPALLLITHDLPAAATCENIAVLHDGAIIESGDTCSVLTRPEHPVTAAMCEASAEETIDGALAAAGAVA
ncbi:ABC transporter ATP-binding protein [Actinomyces sp. HMSC075C01]|uniref:ABC transporter ATP-binding protein n=1 Tax=Actinomyces oris TaxID=544580 RepID=A0A1Q8VPL7_9ACTO|nr:MULTISPECIES: ATP-binding cassette domain-containing protein [Actinomyces]OFR50024.1 ABC transporter ATP-binding protein [Actinomyces sp. HMSC075C01]OLO50047.1 ABC transporter ATP-binding protein [Actinomyces oris]